MAKVDGLDAPRMEGQILASMPMSNFNLKKFTKYYFFQQIKFVGFCENLKGSFDHKWQ